MTLLLAGLLAFAGIVPPATAADEDAETTPLTVTLTTLSPSSIPERGPIVLAGTVRNDSEETWSAINVHPFVSRTPITNRDELAAAAQSDETTEVGTRLVEPGQFAAIGDLPPGASTFFRISLPRRVLGISGAPGVYWIGVHALGQNADGRDGLADGRARTFIPLVARGVRTSVSVVVPVRGKVRFAPDGRVLSARAWAKSFREGRMSHLAGLIGSAGATPLVVLLDPALLDVAASLAAGNPPLSLGPEPEEEPEEPEDPATPEATPTSRAADRLAEPDVAAAKTWLEEIVSGIQAHSLLGLGYADPDTSSLARRRPQLLERADELTRAALSRHSLAATPAVAPPDGWLDEDALAELPEETTVLVSDHGAPRLRSQWRSESGQALVFTDADAAAGGPAPEPTQSALAVRQRILAEAALRADERPDDPMVVSLPADWDPGPDWSEARFFAGLRTPWLNLVGLGRKTGAPVFDAGLPYPQAQRQAELGTRNVAATRTLTDTGRVLGSLLDSENDAESVLAGVALTAVSVQARSDRASARERVLATDADVRRVMGGVEVQGTDFVTLSGGSGTLTVTLVNRLDQPVVAGVRAHTTDPDLKISAAKPQRLDAGQRAVVRLHAEAGNIGVRTVVISPVTEDGDALGTPLTFSLRTSQVGRLIWAILISAAALLVVMIVRRVRRGLREHRWRGQ